MNLFGCKEFVLINSSINVMTRERLGLKNESVKVSFNGLTSLTLQRLLEVVNE